MKKKYLISSFILTSLLLSGCDITPVTSLSTSSSSSNGSSSISNSVISNTSNSSNTNTLSSNSLISSSNEITSSLSSESPSSSDSSITSSHGVSSYSSSLSSSLSSESEEEKIEKALKLVTLKIDEIENKYIDDIKVSDILVSGYDQSLYQINLSLSLDEINNTLTVKYYLFKDLLTSSTSSYTFKGFKKRENEIVTSLCLLELDEGSSTSFKVNVSGPINDSLLVLLKTNNEYLLLSSSFLTFTKDNKEEQTVTVSSSHLSSNYEDIETSIVLSINETVIKEIKVKIKNIDEEEKYEIITPVKEGFITAPLYYYTAYYDTDYKIDKMFVELDNSGVWKELKLYDFASFTSSSCMFELPYEGYSNYVQGIFPSVKLKAYYTEKVNKIEGTPIFELDGYRIKATLGDYVEYFTPSATIPEMRINVNDSEKITDYKKFTRVTKSGNTESFYLALRPKSTSRFSIDGLSPSNFEKIFVLTQNKRGDLYYHRLEGMYGVSNPYTDMKFYDVTPKDSPNYNLWRSLLEESIEVFNESFKSYNINAKLSEVDTSSETKNFISYGGVMNNYAGLCTYNNSSNSFAIYVNSDTNLVYPRDLKSTIVHELGHLLGFSDSAYALDDSLYSYSRDHSLVTYPQPNDLATLNAWLKGI